MFASLAEEHLPRTSMGKTRSQGPPWSGQSFGSGSTHSSGAPAVAHWLGDSRECCEAAPSVGFVSRIALSVRFVAGTSPNSSGMSVVQTALSAVLCQMPRRPLLRWMFSSVVVALHKVQPSSASQSWRPAPSPSCSAARLAMMQSTLSSSLLVENSLFREGMWQLVSCLPAGRSAVVDTAADDAFTQGGLEGLDDSERATSDTLAASASQVARDLRRLRFVAGNAACAFLFSEMPA